jgi:hypothetical protein
MAKRVIMPRKALNDVLALVRLRSDQLRTLAELFSGAESASPFRRTFVNRVAESLSVPIDSARSLITVVHFLLLQSSDLRQFDDSIAQEIVEDLREYVEQNAATDDKTQLLENFDAGRAEFQSLATPKQGRVRAMKIRRLSSGPEHTVQSVRTLCQLRPLFEGEEHNEQIVGLVPNIVLVIEALNDNDDTTTFAFELAPAVLDELERTVSRTKEKLSGIRAKYGTDLLTEE